MYISTTHSKKLRRTRKPKDELASFILKHVSPYSYGWTYDEKPTRYKNEEIIRQRNERGWMTGLTRTRIYEHLAGDVKYFYADGRKSVEQTLTGIDVDCHDHGTYESAVAFAAWLQENFFPGLYYEPSTHGNGVHGYILFCKMGLKDVGVNVWLKRLEKTLKRLLQVFLAIHPEHSIEDVEIKGTAHEIMWEDGKIIHLKAGSLMKLPARIYLADEFEKLKGTMLVDVYDIEKLEETASRLPVTIKMPARKKTGSLRNHIVLDEDLAAITGRYLEIAREWVPAPLATSHRAVVEASDVAIAIAIVKSCTREMNADGSMPTKRIKALWDVLYGLGAITRAFSKNRWCAIRNLMEQQGVIQMQDRVYHPSAARDKKGEAARWCFTEEFLGRLDGVDAGGNKDREIPWVQQENEPLTIPLSYSDSGDEEIPWEEPSVWLDDIHEIPFPLTIGLIEGAWLQVEQLQAG
jgi:hypothetical protein